MKALYRLNLFLRLRNSKDAFTFHLDDTSHKSFSICAPRVSKSERLLIPLLLHDPYEEMFDNLERMDTFYDDCHRARVFLQNLRNDASKAVKDADRESNYRTMVGLPKEKKFAYDYQGDGKNCVVLATGRYW